MPKVGSGSRAAWWVLFVLFLGSCVPSDESSKRGTPERRAVPDSAAIESPGLPADTLRPQATPEPVAPDHAPPEAAPPKPETPKPETPKPETPKPETPKPEIPKPAPATPAPASPKSTETEVTEPVPAVPETTERQAKVETEKSQPETTATPQPAPPESLAGEATAPEPTRDGAVRDTVPAPQPRPAEPQAVQPAPEEEELRTSPIPGEAPRPPADAQAAVPSPEAQDSLPPAQVQQTGPPIVPGQLPPGPLAAGQRPPPQTGLPADSLGAPPDTMIRPDRPFGEPLPGQTYPSSSPTAESPIPSSQEADRRIVMPADAAAPADTTGLSSAPETQAPARPATRRIALPTLDDLVEGGQVVLKAEETPDTIWNPYGGAEVWSGTPGLMPSQDALLYRLSQQWFSRQRLREGRLLTSRTQMHEDSIGYEPRRYSGPVLVENGVVQNFPDSLGYRRLVPPKPKLRGTDLVQQQISARQDLGLIEITRQQGQTPVEPNVRMTQAEYLRRLNASQWRQLWIAEAVRGLKTTALAGTRKGLARVDLPIELPSQLRGIFGEGKPNLSARGSERISFGGTSRWRPNEVRTEINRRQSKFPQLDMRQELNLQVTGTIGDKVSVDVDQSSQSTTPLANRIKIHYTGYEDEILQKVDLGNTNLSLPGTQYVSSGGHAEGLFGINAQAKLGDIGITTILSKQEGKNDSKSVTRSAETKTVRIEDFSFIGGKYFLLRDPDGCPWQLDENTLEIYVDDRIGGNDRLNGAVPAYATLDGSQESAVRYQGSFHRLQPPPNGDYQIQKDIYTGHHLLILTSPLEELDALAVSYSGWNLDANLTRRDYFTVGGEVLPSGSTVIPDTLVLKMVRPTSVLLGTNLTRGPWRTLGNLEMKNIYDLGGRNILPDGFDLRVRLKGTFGDVNDPDRIGDVTFLQVMGLDLSRETTQGRVPGRDDRVDPEFISYESGLLHFPDLRPFDPTAIDLGQEAINCGDFAYYRFLPWGRGDIQRAPRPRALPSTPDSAFTFRAEAIYDSVTSKNPLADSRYYLEVTFRSPVSKIQLNAFGILPGSETVMAGGRTLVRERDYRIDYDIGEVEILESANVTESEEIRVTYSYVPFGGGGSQVTLAGGSAQYRPEASKMSFSSSWMYQSKGGVPGVEGRRPRLGQEPSRTLVGEFAGDYKTESRLLTSLVNAIPGLDARQPSNLNFSFGMGLSLPNPNTRDKLYIDDFDQAKEVMALTMSRRSWRPSGIPATDILPGSELPPGERETLLASRKADAWWFSPRATVQERDLQPRLEEREGDDNRQVLRVQMFPRGETPEERKENWAGFVQVLSARGMDLSRAQFLDVWINDFRQYQPIPDPAHTRRGKMVIDLGTVGEDAMWYRNNPRRPETYRLVPPNGRLDTEDQNGDDRLDQGTDLNEDVGLDTLRQGSPGADPYDVYHYDESTREDDPNKYAGVNGTEGNQDLDTEDLNGNDVLDRLSSYFEIPVDLADSTLWETDVYRDYYARDPNPPSRPLDPSNGWRRIRIPLSDSLVSMVKDFESPDPAWEKIFHARIWFTGFEDSTLIEIGGVEITGNRWYENPIADLHDRRVPPDSLALGEAFYVGVVNNKDDAAIYSPPVSTRKQNDIVEREQSITLNFENFQPGHRASIYRSYSQKQDYTLYENMEFLINRRFESGEADLTCAIRLSRDAASDTTNYYEYRLPVPSTWQTIEIDFAELSQLQLEAADSINHIVTRNLGGGAVMVRKGNPTLTDVKRITFIVTNDEEPGGRVLEKGSVWINELRLTSVKKDPGMASRVAVNAKLSDVADLAFSLNRTGADFLKLGQDRGNGTTTTSWNYSGAFNLDRFAARLGVQAPLRTSMRSSRSVPKFRANSDLTLKKATDRDISESQARELNLSLSKRGSKSGLVRYLVEPFTLSGSYQRAFNIIPTSRDTTITRSGSLGWNFPMEQWGNLRLPKVRLPLVGKGRPGAQPLGGAGAPEDATIFRPLPTSLALSVAGGNTRQRRSSRTDLFNAYERQPSSDRTSGSMTLSSGMHPISPVNYRIESSRDLMLRDNQQQYLGMNLGREVSRRQTLTASYDPPILRTALSPHVTWSGNSTLSLAEQQSGGLEGEPTRSNRFNNSTSTNYSARFSLPELYKSFSGVGRRPAQPDTGTAPPGTAPPPPPSPPKPGGSRKGFLQSISLGVVNVGYTVSTQTSFSRRKGEPDILYQLALSDIPGRGMRSLSRSTDQRSGTKSLNLDTNLRLPKRISMTTRYSRQQGNDMNSGLRSSNLTRKWPDFDFNWGDLHQIIKLDKLVQSFTASTRFSREMRQIGSASGPKDRLTESSSFAPLINISATLKNGISATLNSSARSSTESQFRPALSVTERGDKQLALTLKKTMSLVRRIKNPVTQREQTLSTSMDVNATFDWKANKAESRSAGRKPTVTENRSSWKLGAGAGYKFTQTISGNGSLNFGQDTDHKNQANTARYIGLTVSASFTF